MVTRRKTRGVATLSRPRRAKSENASATQGTDMTTMRARISTSSNGKKKRLRSRKGPSFTSKLSWGRVICSWVGNHDFFFQFRRRDEGDYLDDIEERNKVFKRSKKELIDKIKEADVVCGTRSLLVILNTDHDATYYQVWSLTQFYSVGFSKSRIDVKKVRLQQTYNHGLHQLLLMMSLDLHA